MPSVKSAYQKNNFLISQPEHVVGTQKSRLHETVLLITLVDTRKSRFHETVLLSTQTYAKNYG